MKLNQKPINVLTLGIGMIAMTLFGVIAYFVITNDTLTFDTTIRYAVYGLRNDIVTPILTAITYIGNWQTVTTICVLALLIPRLRTVYGIPLTFSAITSTILYKLIKTAIARPRPDLSLHLIVQGGYSFPSGHSMTGLVFYGFLIYLCRQNLKNKTAKNIITVLLSLLIVTIGFSRIYLGVHFPSDILGGWSLGTVVLVLLISLHKHLYGKQ